jgi:hypothetical protein
VAHRHPQPPPVGQFLLKLLLPQAGPTTVAATGVAQDQQLVGVRIPAPSVVLPPPRDRVGRERGGVGRQPHVDVAPITTHVVETVGDGPAQGVVQEVVGIDLLGRAAPAPPRVLEVADQLLFLAVYADRGIVQDREPLPLAADVVELPVPVGVRRAGEALPVGPQRVAEIIQKAVDRRYTDAETLFLQAGGQVGDAVANPLLAVRGVAGGLLLDQLLQGAHQGRVFFFTAGRPAPGRRMRPGGQSSKQASNSRRPRRIVSTFRPVIKDSRRSPPRPTFSASRATNQRRFCSSKRLSRRLSR